MKNLQTPEKLQNSSFSTNDVIQIDSIVSDIMDELDGSASEWGKDFDAKNTLNDWTSFVCDYASSAGHWKNPLSESREKLIKAAGLCINAIRQIDSGTLAKRHYDD